MLKLHNVSKYYKSNDVVALGLRRVSLEFNVGEFIAVTGESGSGKSPLLNVISGLDSYEDGEMYIGGEETSYFTIEEWENYRKQYIGFVFQNYNIIDSYTVLDNVLMALQIQGYDKTKRKDRAKELIKRVGLESHMHHKAAKLSGGQRQRCVIARALAKDCPVIVADEPTGNLDQATSKTIIELLKEISKDKLVVVVTHNYDEIKDYATRKIRLFDGEVVEDQHIKKTEVTAGEITIIDYHMNHFELMKIALKNLVRKPRLSFFTIIIAIFIVAAFIFGFGSYKQDSTSTFSTWNQFFPNVTKGRIIVADFDGEPFTSDDIEDFEEMNNVLGVLTHDVILDSQIYLFQDEKRGDYYYEEEPIGGADNSNEGDIHIYSNALFINPAIMVDKFDLEAGRLPESKYEVLLEERMEYEVGDVVRMGFTSFYGSVDSFDDIEGYDFTVVGIVRDGFSSDWRSRGYFHDDFINSDEVFILSYFRSGYEGSVLNVNFLIDDVEVYVEKYGESSMVRIDNTLSDNEIKISDVALRNILGDEVVLDYVTIDAEVEGCYAEGKSWEECSELQRQLRMQPYLDFLDENPNYFTNAEIIISTSSLFYDKEVTVEVVGVVETTAYEEYSAPLFYMNHDTIKELVSEEYYQVTVIVKGSYQADIVQKELSKLSLRNIYPNGIQSQEEAFFSIFNYIFLGITFGFFLTITYFIVYLVLRNVQLSKKKDYLVYRSIGASKRDLNFTTIYELVFATTIGYIITLGLFIINENVKTSIPRLLQYLDFTNYAVSFLLLTLIAVMLGNRFNKKIFNRSVITALRQE